MAMDLLRIYDSHVYSNAHQIRNCKTCKPNILNQDFHFVYHQYWKRV